MSDPAKIGVSRRTLAKGAAWTVPAAAVVAAAPVYAVSQPVPPPGLQGWVAVSKSCFLGYGSISFDSSPNSSKPRDPFVPEQWGLWVYNTQSDWQFSNVTITVGIDASRAPITGGGNNWSQPTLVSTPSGWGSNIRAYQTTYTGGWTFHADPDGNPDTYPVAYTKVNGRLQLSSDSFGSCRSELRQWIRRCVTITRPNPRPGELSQETICFNRHLDV